ncbi:MAG: sensor histidine kinase [Candidatus Limnocylindrus sp.]
MELLYIITGVALLAATLSVRSAARARAELQRISDEVALPNATDVVSTEDPVSTIRAISQMAAASDASAAAAQDELNSLLAGIDLGVVLVSADARVTSANAAAHRIFERPEGAMEGRPLIEALADLPAFEFYRDGASLPKSIELEGSRGKSRALSVLEAPGGGRWLLAQDTSEVVRLRRIRTEFVDNLSHELRTPITTIGLLSESLGVVARADATTPTRLREGIATIEAETQNLGQMVAELLDLARVESGVGMEFDEGVDLDALVSTAAHRLLPFAQNEGVSIEIAPSAGIPTPIRANPNRLAQVIVNLVHNAVKFSSRGGTIWINTVWDPDQVSVSVRDAGSGIARADLDRVFERFYKADRARTNRGGTGLGLSISRHIVEAHGGTIQAESELGGGSTFTFILPLQRG